MEALIAAAAGACAPGCAGLVAAAGLPVVSLVGIAGAVGLALYRARIDAQEPVDEKTELAPPAPEPSGTYDFL